MCYFEKNEMALLHQYQGHCVTYSIVGWNRIQSNQASETHLAKCVRLYERSHYLRTSKQNIENNISLQNTVKVKMICDVIPL